MEKEQLKKGPWTAEEDQKLVAHIQKHGHPNWRQLPIQAGLQRCGKSCRLRWTNYLRPDIKRGNFSWEEDQTIISLHAILGNKWSVIAARLKGRTDNEIKNRWNSLLKKNLLRMGIDPMTHQPLNRTVAHFLNQQAAHNNNMLQCASPSLQQHEHYSGATQLNALRSNENLLQSLLPQNECNMYYSSPSSYEYLNQQKEMGTIFNNVVVDERMGMPMLNPHVNNMLPLPADCTLVAPFGYQPHLLLQDSNVHTQASG